MGNWTIRTSDKPSVDGADCSARVGGISAARMLARATVAFCALALGSPLAQAQAKFPDKPVRIVVPFGPGGVGDLTMRLLGQRMSEITGQPFVIENRPGAGGRRAMGMVLDSPADGYTMGVTGNGQAITMSLFKKRPYDIVNDFSQVSRVASFDIHVTVKGDSSLKTLRDVVETARKNPGKLNFGTILPGSTQNLSAHLLAQNENIKASIITYKTTPDLITAILRGDIDVGFEFYASLAGSIKDGKLRVVATAGEERTAHLPDVPTAKEGGFPYYIVQSWNGLATKAGLPATVANYLSDNIKIALNDGKVRAQAKVLGLNLVPSTPAGMRERIAHDVARWAKIIEQAGIAKR